MVSNRGFKQTIYLSLQMIALVGRLCVGKPTPGVFAVVRGDKVMEVLCSETVVATSVIVVMIPPGAIWEAECAVTPKGVGQRHLVPLTRSAHVEPLLQRNP